MAFNSSDEKISRCSRRKILLTGGVALAFNSKSYAEIPYPIKPIKLVVPFATGGALDLFNRQVTSELSSITNQPFIIQNSDGASGIVGSNIVAKSEPNGYTLLTAFASQFLQPFFRKNIPFDIHRDFEPIVAAANAPIAIVVNSKVPVTSIQDLITYAKKYESLSYATSGNFTIQHLTGKILEKETGVKLNHIPYKGASPATLDLLNGSIPIGILALGPLVRLIKSGNLRPLAVLENQRTAIFPSIPTLVESGFKELAMPDNWIGYFAPKNTDSKKIEFLNKSINKSISQEAIKSELKKYGYEITGGSVTQFKELIDLTLEKYKWLTKLAGVLSD